MTRMLKESLKDLIRHKLSSVVIAVVISLCVFCLGTIATVILNINKLEKRWSEDIRVIVFPSKNMEDRTALLNSINALQGVTHVQPVSSDEAAGILRKRFPDEDILFSSTIIPEFIEITVGSSSVESIVSKLKANSNVDDVVVNYSWLKSLKDVLSVIRYSAGLGISFVLLLSLLLLSYSARIDAIHRKSEMEIYRLCGATEWYIRFPYIAGGAIIGLFGSAVGLVVFYILKTVFQGFVIHFSSVFVSSFSYTDIPFILVVVLVLFGPLLGAVGHLFAFLAIRRSGE